MIHVTPPPPRRRSPTGRELRMHNNLFPAVCTNALPQHPQQYGEISARGVVRPYPLRQHGRVPPHDDLFVRGEARCRHLRRVQATVSNSSSRLRECPELGRQSFCSSSTRSSSSGGRGVEYVRGHGQKDCCAGG